MKRWNYYNMTAGGSRMNVLLMENLMRRMIHLVCIAAVVFFMASCEGKAQGVSDNKPELQSTPIIQEESQQAEPEQEEILVDNLEGTPLDIDSMSDEEKESFLTGTWYIFFPTPNQNWGHDFQQDQNYEYWDHSPKAMQQRYRYTDGMWRIDGDAIQVKMATYQIADRDMVEDIFGFGFPSDTEYSNVFVEDDTWHTIGTLESIRTGIVRDGWELPPRITLHPLLFDQVLDEEKYYYRDRP